MVGSKSDSLEHFYKESGRGSAKKRRRVQFFRVFVTVVFSIRPEYSNSRSKRGETLKFLVKKHEFAHRDLGPP